MQNRTKIRHLRLLRNFNDFLRFWVPFLITFGSNLASKSHSKSEQNFGMLFCRVTRLWRGCDGAAAGLRRQCSGGPFAADAPRRRPFRARDDPITPYRRVAAACRKHRKRDFTRRGPEARRITVQRGGTESARSPMTPAARKLPV